MGLKEAFQQILKLGQGGASHTKPPASMVLLLKEPRFPNLERLREAAELAYGVKFSLQKTDRNCVYTEILFTIMKVGPHALSFMFYTKPYSSDSPTLARAWKLPVQRAAWAEHTSFLAIDYAKGGIDFESRYALLARLCRHLYDANCVGIYLPRERAFVPGEGSVRDMLNQAIASRNVDVT
jgi:hypothetical protein